MHFLGHPVENLLKLKRVIRTYVDRTAVTVTFVNIKLFVLVIGKDESHANLSQTWIEFELGLSLAVPKIH